MSALAQQLVFCIPWEDIVDVYSIQSGRYRMMNIILDRARYIFIGTVFWYGIIAYRHRLPGTIFDPIDHQIKS